MAGKEALFIGIGRLELSLPGVRSLKEKRSRTRSLVDKIRNRHQVVLLELSFRDLYQKAGFAICAISSERRDLDARFKRIEQTIDRNWEGRILSWEIEILQL